MKELGKYSVKPCSANPMLISVLIDGSASMADVMPQTGMRKCDVVATLVNKLMQELSITCSKDVVKPYYHLHVSHYTGDKVVNAFAAIEGLPDKPVYCISEIINNPLRIENRLTKKLTPTGDVIDEVKEFAVWVEPMASGGTPMAAALHTAIDVVSNWIPEHPGAHAPVVIHITDGEATDANAETLERLADTIKSLENEDGKTILLNAHITAEGNAKAVNYAVSEDEVTSNYGKMLWRCSSEIPEEMVASVTAVLGDGVIKPGSRFCVFNADEIGIAGFIEVGTAGTSPLPDPNR